MTIKKSTATLKKAELFEQLALRSLAQIAGDPLNSQVGTQYVDEKGSLHDTRSPDQIAAEVAKNMPWLAKKPKPSGGHGNILPKGPAPAEVRDELRRELVPGPAAALLAPYKGKLEVKVEGKNLKVIYNARLMSDTALQSKLQSALPGWNVSVLGETQFAPGRANY